MGSLYRLYLISHREGDHAESQQQDLLHLQVCQVGGCRQTSQSGYLRHTACNEMQHRVMRVMMVMMTMMMMLLLLDCQLAAWCEHMLLSKSGP